MFAGLKPTELLIILLVVFLLFGAKKLPDTARGLGQALRIFKAETKGLRDDDQPSTAAQPPAAPAVPREIAPQPVQAPQSQPVRDADPADRTQP